MNKIKTLFFLGFFFLNIPNIQAQVHDQSWRDIVNRKEILKKLITSMF